MTVDCMPGTLTPFEFEVLAIMYVVACLVTWLAERRVK